MSEDGIEARGPLFALFFEDDKVVLGGCNYPYSSENAYFIRRVNNVVQFGALSYKNENIDGNIWVTWDDDGKINSKSRKRFCFDDFEPSGNAFPLLLLNHNPRQKSLLWNPLKAKKEALEKEKTAEKTE